MNTSPFALRRIVYRIFRTMPLRARVRVVRALTPNYTLGAVVLLRDAGGALLLLRQPPGFGWSLPGGLLGRREEPASAAARELAEETGITLPPGTLTPAQPNVRINVTAQQVDTVFTATVDQSDLTLALDPIEVLEAGWFAPDALPPLTVATARLLALYGIGPYAHYQEDGTPADPARAAVTTTPEVTVPEVTVPDDTVPDDAVRDDALPDDTVPDDTAPNDTAPDDTAPHDAVPDDTVPDDTAPDNAAPDRPASGPVSPAR